MGYSPKERKKIAKYPLSWFHMKGILQKIAKYTPTTNRTA